MSFSWSTLGFQVLNFLVLVWLLRHFLWRPVLATIARRREETEGALARASAERASAQALVEATEAERARIGGERDRLLGDGRAQLERERETLIDRARGEAAAVLGAGRRQLAVEREGALDGLRQHTTDLAVEIAAHLLRTMAPDLSAVPFLARAEAALRALPPDRLAALQRQLGPGAVLRVAVAPPLDEAATTAWRARLQAVLGVSAAVEFSVEDALLAGVELHFPQAILRHNLRDGIEQARQALETHARAS